MYYATNRTFTCKHTARVYTKHEDPINHKTKMVDSEGNELTSYYASGINGIQYRYPNGAIIELNAGELIDNSVTKGRPTHIKYSGQKRFKKL